MSRSVRESSFFAGIGGAIFDLDGTILDSMPMWRALCPALLCEHGILHGDLNNVLAAKTLRQSADFIADTFPIKLTGDEILNKWEAEVTWQYENVLQLKDGAAEFLAFLKEGGIGLCVATLTDRRHAVPALSRLGVLDMFEFVVTVPEVGRGKHFPDVYLEAAERLRLRPQQCLVFEDTLYAIETAKRAGFRVCAVYDDSQKRVRTEIEAASDVFINCFTEYVRT